MNLTFSTSSPVLSARNEGTRAIRRAAVSVAPGATFTARSCQPSVTASRRQSVAKKCRDVAIRDGPFRDGLPIAAVHLQQLHYLYATRITFISIMTGEHLNLHGKSHRPRNEARPRIRNSRSIGVCRHLHGKNSFAGVFKNLAG